MAYIELHQALFNHRKTIAAADLLGIPEVHLVGHLAALWSWSLDNCNDGILPDSCRTVARASCWTGDSNLLVDALQDAGFLDKQDGHLVIHDWDQYGGKLIEKRRTNAEKQARYREEQQTRKRHSEDVTVTSRPHDTLEKSREEKSINVTPLPPKGERYSGEFLEFWDAYPRKKNKDEAWRAWKQRRDRPPLAVLISSVQAHQVTADWQKDGGQFIPYPATWLRKGGWQDETPGANGLNGAVDWSDPVQVESYRKRTEREMLRQL